MLVPFSCPQKCSCILQCKKLLLNLLVSPAFFTVRPLGEIHIHSPCILIAHCSPPCNLVLHSHFSETLLSGLSVTELMNCFFWYAFLIFLCLCNIYTIEQPFLDGVLSLEDVILCHNC